MLDFLLNELHINLRDAEAANLSTNRNAALQRAANVAIILRTLGYEPDPRP